MDQAIYSEWDLAKVQQHIRDGIQESISLEYKSADALAKSDSKKAEITKDVSAMANSAGGEIIYGVKEYDAQDKRHLPEKIDPIDQTLYSREWLEQVINNIRPRIDGLVIYPITLETSVNQTIYVVEIPASTTAHQALDKRYYKRFNFQSIAMEDYEIRDVMRRSEEPVIDLSLEIHYTPLVDNKDVSLLSFPNLGKKGAEKKSKFYLYAILGNNSKTIANHVIGFVFVPRNLVHPLVVNMGQASEDKNIIQFAVQNQNPVLPGIAWRQRTCALCDELDSLHLGSSFIWWSIQADNSPPVTGQVPITSIKVVRDG